MSHPVAPPSGPRRARKREEASSSGSTAATPAAERAEERGLTLRERKLAARRARQRRARKQLSVLLGALLVFALVITLITVGLRQLLGMNEPDSYPGPGETPVSIEVKPGTGQSAVFAQLKDKDVISSETGFARSFAQLSDGAQIQPGRYELKTKMSNEEAVRVLVAKDLSKVFYVPVAGNSRIDDVLKTLSESTRISLSQFQDAVKDPSKYGVSSKAKTLEGYLAPGEYRFDVNTKPEDMIRQMVDRQKSTLSQQGVTDPEQQYLILTKASIVEAEGNPKNYSVIAGALNNRVDRPNKDTGGFINSDATVTYGLKSRTLHLSEEQKKDKKNPYNTYANKGLPVGPIGSPEKAAITATVHPDKNDYYYWVTVNIKTGETLYARTYEEHQVNEKKYQQYCEEHPDVCQ